MKVLAHLDPLALEHELLSRVDAVHPRDASTGTLVLTPTAGLARHLLRRLAEVREAWLGLHVLQFRGLALSILERETGTTPSVASPLLLEALLRDLLERRSTNPWAVLVRKRPGTLGRLLGALTDLREAGLRAEELETEARDERQKALAEIHRLYDEALERLATRGFTDDAGLMRAATPHARTFGGRHGSTFVHGAYELLGVHLALLGEIGRGSELTVLVPVEPGAPGTSYAESFAREFLLEPGAEIERAIGAGDERRRRRLAALYDEESRPEPAPAGTLHFRHTQGPLAEIKFAVRQALRAVHNGCPPTEIAITARTLEPYAAAIEEAFDEAGLPWTSSLASPLRRHPVVRDFLLLLQVIDERFPRDRTIELLRSTHFKWKKLGLDRRPWADPADVWSREAGIIDGLEAWTCDLETWVAQPDGASAKVEQARLVGQALAALDRRVDRTAALFGTHAARLSDLLALLRVPETGPPAEALEQLGRIVAEMDRLERVVGDRRTVSFHAMRDWLEDAVDACGLTLHADDGGGIRVLDAMQLRGLTFRQIHFVGLNSGWFPRPPREDPVLGDDLRKRLRARSGRPLAVKLRGTSEERLLLLLIVGAARERLDVSWQRADESGRARIPSLALREIARLACGRPEIAVIDEVARHLPSHPTQWLEELLAATGLLAPAESALLGALHCRDATATTALAQRFPDLAPGLEMLRATQSFIPVRDAYDARIGAQPQKALSVTALETLGRCPLQFFFKEVLRVRELEQQASLFALAPNELGSAIHALLERVYTRLHEEQRFDAGRSETLVKRGLELLEEQREQVLGRVGGRLAARLPLLWRSVAAVWLETLRRFVRADLGRIAELGLRPGAFEVLTTTELDFGQGIVRSVRGKFDRLLHSPSGTVVSDYKTSKNLGFRAEATKMLKAETLQVPLYRLLADGEATVELLGVHPELDPAEDRHRVDFNGFENGDLTRSFGDTMRTLYRLRDDGSFPFNSGKHCEWCPYDMACRRHHPPTVDRQDLLADGRAYRKVQKKSTRNPDGP